MGCGEPPYPYSAPSVRNARVLSIRGAVYGVTDYYGAHTARRGPLCPEHNALDLSRARIDVSPSIPLLFPGANRSFSVPSSLSPLFSFRSLLSSRKVPWRNGAIVNLTLRQTNCPARKISLVRPFLLFLSVFPPSNFLAPTINFDHLPDSC